MKKYILLILLIIGIGFNSCKNAYEKEIGEIEGLVSIINEAEKNLLSLDTAKVFAAKRQMQKDLRLIENSHDTLTKDESFRLDDLFSCKKRLYRLTGNYSKYVGQINFSKKQLADIKQDMENGLMSIEEFKKNLSIERNFVIDLNMQINKEVNGLDVQIEKLKLFRPEIEEIINRNKTSEVQ